MQIMSLLIFFIKLLMYLPLHSPPVLYKYLLSLPLPMPNMPGHTNLHIMRSSIHPLTVLMHMSRRNICGPLLLFQLLLPMSNLFNKSIELHFLPRLPLPNKLHMSMQNQLLPITKFMRILRSKPKLHTNRQHLQM